MFCIAVLSIISGFDVEEGASCLNISSFCCHVPISVLCFVLTVPWVGLQCVIVAISCNTHIFFIYFNFHLLCYYFQRQAF